MDELNRLIVEYFEYAMTDVHTALPGVVVKYDPKTRRADVQPSLKRKLPGGKFLKFPVIPDVPVLFPGSKKYTLHFPLEEGDEVLLIVTERALRTWKSKGGKGIEESSPRRFDIQDCTAVPGLQAVDFIPVEEDGLNIVHKTKPDGELVSRVTMDDEKVEVQYKDAAITLNKDKMILDNGKNKFELAGPVSLISTGSDLVEIGNTVDTLGGILDALFTALTSLHTEGSPAAHTASAWAASDIAPLKAKAAQVFKK